MRLIVEADGGSRGNPGPAAFGALVRDSESGAVLAETAETLGTVTNNVAEYRGLIAGLRLAADVDATADVEVRMDSKLVVEQMAGRWKIKHPDLRPLAAEASQALPRGVTTWTWVPRGQNARADALVNAALDGKLDTVVEHPGASGATMREAGGMPEQTSDPAGGVSVAGAPEVAPVPAERVAAAVGRPSATTTLLWLRHGRTADAAARRFIGPRGSHPGLDELGRHQSAVVAAALSDASISAVVSSPGRSARETAEVVAGPLGLGVSIDHAFADLDPGSWDGATSEEVRAATPAWHAAWSVSPEVAPPEGESMRAVQARVAAGVSRLLQRYPGRRVLVVSHAVPIACSLVTALEAPLSSAMRLGVSDGSVSVVRHPVDGPPRTYGIALPPGTVLSD